MSKPSSVLSKGLAKSFGKTHAVLPLDLDIKRGELFGLVGPDGAGKTTALRMLSAILSPSAGDAYVEGFSVVDEPELVKGRIAYMPQRFGLYEDLTVMENLLFYADIYEVPQKERDGRIRRLMDFSSLADFTGRLAGRLSGGMKQKLGLACALIHTPSVLILDEPTNGVDPVSRRDFWRILYGLLKEGITVLVSTSYLDEAERCTRIALMHKGSVMAIDAPDALRRSLNVYMAEVWCPQARLAADYALSIGGVIGASVYGDRLHVSLKSHDRMEEVKNRLANAGFTVRAVREIVPSVEDVFISMVGGR